MNKTIVKAAPGMCVVLALLLTWACAPAPQNVNVTPNQNANGNKNANTAPPAQLLSSACSENNLDKRRENVYNKIKDDLEKSDLKDQYAAGKIKFDVVKAEGPTANTLYLFVEGRVTGRKNFELLADILDNFVNEKCASRVLFVEPGTIKSGGSLTLSGDPGFEWTSCDYPNEPCPNGECREPGTCPMGTPNANVNANVNTNTRPANPNTNINATRRP